MNDDLTYDVDYDDGYAEKNLPAKLLKPPKPFKVGDKVDARFRGWRTFYPGTIHKVHSTSLYDVAYDDGYTETDVSSKYIRPRLEAAKPPQQIQFEFAPGRSGRREVSRRPEKIRGDNRTRAAERRHV